MPRHSERGAEDVRDKAGVVPSATSSHPSIEKLCGGYWRSLPMYLRPKKGDKLD